MVREQLVARGVRDPRVLDALARVPRERFVPSGLEESATEDRPLGIGQGQTISQPYIVAYMAEAAELTGEERVLEIGTGSGYGAAVLAEVAGEVYTIERIEWLAEAARKRLEELGYGAVHVRHGDGTKGWVEAAPFDAILVTAAGPAAPNALLEQLRIGGRLVIPVGSAARYQNLLRIRRMTEDRYEEEDLGSVSFVPLIGDEGWPGRNSASDPSSL